MSRINTDDDVGGQLHKWNAPR